MLFKEKNYLEENLISKERKRKQLIFYSSLGAVAFAFFNVVMYYLSNF